VAGRLRRKPQLVEKILDELRRQGYAPEAAPTEGPGTAGEVARRRIDAGTGAILVAGGDGTVNEVLNGIVGTGVPLCVLGGGTANVFTNEVGLSSRPEENAARYSTLTPVRVAVGALRRDEGAPATRYFLLMAGAGLDARVVRDVNGSLKARFGKLAYYVSSFGLAFNRLPQFRVRSGGVEKQCGFLLASRVKNYGGDLEIATGANLLEDAFEVVVFEGSYAVRYLPYAAGALFRMLRHMPGVTIFKTTRLELQPVEPEHGVDIQVDGESAGSLPVVLETVPGGLEILVPEAFVRKSRPR
jgi:diacylglycerol kinase (ATP)